MERLSLSEYITKVVWPAFGVTMRILIATVILATILGLIMAMLLTVTKKDGIKPNKFIFNTLDFLINIIRSFPFLILLVSLVPVTRFIMGTSIGERAAIFPLTVSMSPFVARLIASHMDSVEKQLIEATPDTVACYYGRSCSWNCISYKFYICDRIRSNNSCWYGRCRWTGKYCNAVWV